MRDPRKTTIFAMTSWTELQQRLLRFRALGGYLTVGEGWRSTRTGIAIYLGGSVWGWDGRRRELNGAAGAVAMGGDPTDLCDGGLGQRGPRDEGERFGVSVWVEDTRSGGATLGRLPVWIGHSTS